MCNTLPDQPAVPVSVTSIKKRAPVCQPQQLYGDAKSEIYKAERLSKARKIAIAALITLTNLVPMTSFGAGVGGGLAIGSEAFGITSPSKASWIAASYPLTQGAFALMTGRLGAVYGHKNVLLVGCVWWCIWTLINGFCNDFIVFNFARGCSGIGSAMIVPNAVAIIGITFPPGRMRNLVIGFFGAGAPIGGWTGALLSGIFTERTPWKWLFIFMSVLGTLVFGALGFVLPSEIPVSEAERMDWFGSFLGISSLIIFNFVWNQAPSAGWSSPYEIALLLSAILLFTSFATWEHKFAAQPIMPLSIWKAPSFFVLVIVVLFSFMSYGTFIWYLIAWQRLIRNWSVLSVAAGLTPLAICSTVAAITGSWLIPRLAAQWILAIGALAILVSQVLVATMPDQGTYWAQVFPATIIQSFCPDFIFTAAQIIASNNVARHQQGIAASLIAVLQLYGTSIGLGFAGIVETHTNGHGESTSRGYRSALCFGMGLSVVALVASVLFVKMPKDNREGWEEETSVASHELAEAGPRTVV